MRELETLVIVPGRSVGPVSFGMKEADVVEALGAPDVRVDPDEDGDRRLHYSVLGLELYFEEADGRRLGMVELWKPALALIDGAELPRTAETLVAVLKKHGLEFTEGKESMGAKTDEEYEESYSSDDGSTVLFYDGRGDLISLSMGPEIDSSDRVVWAWP